MSVYLHYLTECRLVQYDFGNFFNSRDGGRHEFGRNHCRGLFWGGRAFFYAPKKPKKSPVPDETSSKWERLADFFFASPLQKLDGQSDVFDCQTDRFEQRDLLGQRPARLSADNDFGQVVH